MNWEGKGTVETQLGEALYLEQGLLLPWVRRFFLLQGTTKKEDTGLKWGCLEAADFSFLIKRTFRTAFGDHFGSKDHHILCSANCWFPLPFFPWVSQKTCLQSAPRLSGHLSVMCPKSVWTTSLVSWKGGWLLAFKMNIDLKRKRWEGCQKWEKWLSQANLNAYDIKQHH